jgi:hypothetical protein
VLDRPACEWYMGKRVHNERNGATVMQPLPSRSTEEGGSGGSDGVGGGSCRRGMGINRLTPSVVEMMGGRESVAYVKLWVRRTATF